MNSIQNIGHKINLPYPEISIVLKRINSVRACVGHKLADKGNDPADSPANTMQCHNSPTTTDR